MSYPRIADDCSAAFINDIIISFAPLRVDFSRLPSYNGRAKISYLKLHAALDSLSLAWAKMRGKALHKVVERRMGGSEKHVVAVRAPAVVVDDGASRPAPRGIAHTGVSLAQWRSKFTSLSTYARTLERRIRALEKVEEEFKGAKREIAALSNYAGELEMRVNEGEKVAADLKRVEAELAASEKQHERATRDLSAAAQDVRRLAKYVSHLESMVGDLKHDLGVAHEDNERLEAEKQRIEIMVDAMETQRESMERKTASAAREAAKLQIENDQLQNALADEKQASSALEVMVENLRGQIADGSRALRESTDREAAASKTLAVARQKYEIAISEMNSKLRKSEEKSKSTLEELSRRYKDAVSTHERADRERIANAESKYDLQAQLSAVREDLVRERGARRQAEETVLDMQTKIKEVETQSQELKRLRLVETWVDTSNRITKELSGALRDILKFFEDSLDSDEMFSSTFSTRHHAYSSSLLVFERAKRALQVASKQRNRTKSMHRIKEKRADAWHRWGYCKLLSIVC